MRQVMSTALVALIVASLTAVTVSALAQSEPATTSISPAAVSSINADKVDGRHAVGFTNNKGARRNKLVATNKWGLLPSNIVRPLWNLIQGKPGFLADGQVSWSELQGIPAGFADGVDAGDTTYSYIAATSGYYGVGDTGHLGVSYPATLAVTVSLIPVAEGTVWATHDVNDASGVGDVLFGRDGNEIDHYLYFKNFAGASGQLKARVTVFNAGQLAPAAARQRIEVTFGKGTAVPKP